MEARIRVLEANLDARVVTVVNRASVEEVGGWGVCVCRRGHACGRVAGCWPACLDGRQGIEHDSGRGEEEGRWEGTQHACCSLSSPPSPAHTQVARPPKLRVASYPPTAWSGSPVEGLELRLARARSRLRCAGSNFE